MGVAVDYPCALSPFEFLTLTTQTHSNGPFMRRQMTCRVVGLLLFLMGAWQLVAQQPSTPEEAAVPGPNTPDEPLGERYSPEAAVGYLDAVALDWQRENKCFACHTDYAYLLARPAIAWDVPAHRQIRSAAERAAEQGGLQAKEPARSSESVMLAAALAINDARTTRHAAPHDPAGLGPHVDPPARRRRHGRGPRTANGRPVRLTSTSASP